MVNQTLSAVIKKTLRYMLWVWVVILTLWAVQINVFASNDLLNQAYDEAKKYDYVVNPGNDKNAVWWQVFNDTKVINIWSKDEKKEPYLIRLTKLILRVMIALSVSIIIYGGISYSLSFGDTKKQEKARNIVIYALAGIFIWLASLAIIELVLSITKSSFRF